MRSSETQKLSLSFLYIDLHGPEKIVCFKLLLSESEKRDRKQMFYVYLQESDCVKVSAGQR